MGNYTFEHLNSVNLKHFSQTCLNDHLCQTTNPESPLKQIPIHNRYYLTLPATTFFYSQMKVLHKTITPKLHPAKECETNIRNNA